MARSPLAILLVTALAAGCATPRYASPQFRDGRFHNPSSWPGRPTTRDFFRWVFTRNSAPTDRFQPPVVANDGAALRANRDRLSITWIGHATTLVQVGGVSILTDPIFSRTVGFVSRFAPPGVAMADLPPIDVVVISHDHRDHLDEDSVRALGPKVTYVVPLGLGDWFRARGLPKVIELDWWQQTRIVAHGREARVTLVPAQHWGRRGLDDENLRLWGGYVFDAGGARVYFAGDTGYPAAFAEVGRRFPGIDYAILPIGAYSPRWHMRPVHMAPEEAARAVEELGARAVVPVHWGTFHLSDEPMDEPPLLLREALGEHAGKMVLLAIGGTAWGAPAAAPVPPAKEKVKELVARGAGAASAAVTPASATVPGP
jgi:L-ascorbate metabolism protein UlaG (beta-lactamase superfamily)